MNFKDRLILTLTTCLILTSLSSQTVNWYHGERTDSIQITIGTDHLYEKIIKKKIGRSVVVAVIDSGVDIEHEDLDDVIWTNYNEIPNNGIDDDGNGYIDDINGWNFIGGSDGSQVDGDTFVMVRLYASKRKRFNNVDPNKLDKKELEEYNEWTKWGLKIDKEYNSAKKQYDEYAAQGDVLFPVMDRLAALDQSNGLTLAEIDTLRASYDRVDNIAANVLEYFVKETGSIPPMDQIRSEVVGPIEEIMNLYGPRWKYNYNADYDSRTIVGDDCNNPDESDYGNNLVEGPDAFHGTHVAGIIAAERNNEIGINGIANNARIMVLRAVPNGDERDKDIANAIRYAVDNGASIINMSFGKGHSPYKQTVDDAVRYAEKKDVLIVHAAGNSGADMSTAANFPNDRFLNPKGFLFFKKKQAKNWISVGASSQSQNENMPASFSNFGQNEVDVFAPGTVMYSTTPGNNYEIAQGTSMAAPVISGVAAVIRSYFPALTAEQVKEAIVESTVRSDKMVIKPGTEELVPFSTLSSSGGIVDLQAAFLLAARMKGKKKLVKLKEIRA